MPEENYEKPLEVFNQIRAELKLEKDVGFSLDAAASSFYDKNIKGYRLFLDKSISREELLDIYKTIIKKYKLISLEDPFEENDFENFQKITSLFARKTIIIGDDLTVTNSQLLVKAAEQKAISGIIIKPTQIGTITETLKTVALAHQKQIKIIVSHRSAETLDDFIADLTVASGAWGLKAGAPQPEERMVKYRRVITILSKS
jgi:enolase